MLNFTSNPRFRLRRMSLAIAEYNTPPRTRTVIKNSAISFHVLSPSIAGSHQILILFRHTKAFLLFKLDVQA